MKKLILAMSALSSVILSFGVGRSSKGVTFVTADLAAATLDSRKLEAVLKDVDVTIEPVTIANNAALGGQF